MTEHPRRTPAQLRDRLGAVLAAGTLDLPLPAAGRTAERLRAVTSLAAEDLALARVAEAHVDAVAILHEAGRMAEPGVIYGVWASEAPQAVMQLDDADTGRVLLGRKAFCTGIGIVDRALVTARATEGVRLVDVAVDDAGDRGWTTCTDGWMTDAFADTATAMIEVSELAVRDEDLVGAAGWYFDRVGFWHGALAPAACWAGGALGLIEHCRRVPARDEHGLAHLGVLDALAWELDAVLVAAGDAVDREPYDRAFAARHAARVRTIVERLVGEVLDHAARLGGPRLLAYDAAAARRVAELQLYVRQHHDTRDHAALGRLASS